MTQGDQRFEGLVRPGRQSILYEISGGHSDKRCEWIGQTGQGLIPACNQVMVTDYVRLRCEGINRSNGGIIPVYNQVVIRLYLPGTVTKRG